MQKQDVATNIADSETSYGGKDRGRLHPVRIKSEDLMQHQREVEIDHQGRIYRLRVTQLNKLILTA